MTVSDLPALNASLNALASLFLLAGYVFVRQQRIAAHRACMLAALATSALFLTSYLIYHYNVGSRPFTGTGPIRLVYFAILISHVLLAIAIVPMVLVTVSRALTGASTAIAASHGSRGRCGCTYRSPASSCT